MFFTLFPPATQLWELAYAAYIVWLVGILCWGLLASSGRHIEIRTQLRHEPMVHIPFVTLTLSSVLALSVAWPMLFLFPVYLWNNLGAPAGTMLILYGALELVFWAIAAQGKSRFTLETT